MIVKQIRLSQQAKEQLSRLKGRTGISNWNVLCRWALCLSLREPGVPSDIEIPADSNVEMTWQVFAGEFDEVYTALIVQRCREDGLGDSPAELAKYFRLHLHRGIAYLASSGYVRSIAGLFEILPRPSEHVSHSGEELQHGAVS